MKHELLAPAGSPEICRAAVEAGADAVYLGGNRYGARAFAQNFSEEEIAKALDFCHLRGKKVYLTVNTLLKNREIGKVLYDFLLPLYKQGLDAVIVQDFGVMQFVRRNFPELPIHVSTQMSVANVCGADFLKEAGACRIVPARELSLPEIAALCALPELEVECFIHGALCYCYSGQCLMSSMIGGRSGNRGRCAQPCRLPYQVIEKGGRVLHPKDRYPLSLKDLCAVHFLPALCEAGVSSFKIEGRMKTLSYAAGVTEIYRNYLDAYESDPASYRVDPADMERLLALGNRSGFTEGYFDLHSSRSMLSLTESSHAGAGNAANIQNRRAVDETTLDREERRMSSSYPEQKIPVWGRAVLRCGKPACLTLTTEPSLCRDGSNREGAGSVTVFGDPPSRAESRPVSEEEICKRIGKSKDTPFVIAGLEVELEEGCFIPVGRLNALRRSGLAELSEKLLSPYRRTAKEQNFEPSEKKKWPFAPPAEPFLNVVIASPEQLPEVLDQACVHRVSLDYASDVLREIGKRTKGKAAPEQLQQKFTAVFADLLAESLCAIHAAGKEAAFCFPHVFRLESSGMYEQPELIRVLSQFDILLVRNYDSLGFALQVMHRSPDTLLLDHSLYVFSEEAAHAFAGFGLSHYTVSAELNRKELRHMPNALAEFPLYGRIPMMVSAQCVLKNYGICDKIKFTDTELVLKDRKNKEFSVQRNCMDCYNVICNSRPLFLLHQAEAVRQLGFGSYRISFLRERSLEVQEILESYRTAFLEGGRVEAPAGDPGFTTGHFGRGVE